MPLAVSGRSAIPPFYLRTPSTFFTPSLPVVESRLQVHSVSIWTLRLLRLYWILLTLPLHFFSLLVFYFLPAFPLPDFLEPAISRHPNWNCKQAIVYPLVQRFIWAVPGTGGFPPATTAKGDRVVPYSSIIWAWCVGGRKVEVRQEDLELSKTEITEWIRDEASDVTGRVKVMAVPCFWLEAKRGETELRDLTEKGGGISKAQGRERVVLYLVGGGYIEGNPLITDRCYGLARESGLKILGVNYRKATERSGARSFPAALQDAVVAYASLVKLGYTDIVLAGDSAGAGLCLTLLLYLSTTLALSDRPPRNFLLPTGLLMYSPWVDLTLSSYRGKRMLPELEDDFLNPTMMNFSSNAFLYNIHRNQAYIWSSSHPFLSPSLPSSLPTLQSLSRSYSTPKSPLRILLLSGSSEIFVPEIHSLVRNLRKVDGIELEWIEEKDELHVFFLAPGFISEGSARALKRAGEFLRR